jgi:hypothetical protein
LSPLAAVTVTPRAAPAAHASSNACIAWLVQDDSGPPQLMLITLGLFVVSWIAVVTASKNPWSVLGAK